MLLFLDAKLRKQRDYSHFLGPLVRLWFHEETQGILTIESWQKKKADVHSHNLFP